MAGPIVVDIASGAVDRGELAAILVESCSRAAGGDGCVLGLPSAPTRSARAFAVVWFEGPGERHLRIHVAHLGPTTGTFQARELDFRDEDLQPDRYRAAGLAVAALAGAPAAEEKPVEGPRAPVVEGPRARWALGAGGLVGGGVEAGPPRAGGWFTASVASPGSGFVGSISASYATSVRAPTPQLSVQWLTVGAGGGVWASIAPLRAFVRARVEATASWSLVTAQDAPPKGPAGGPMAAAPDSASLFNLGAATTLDVGWPADGPVAVVAGGNGQLRTHATTLRVHGQPAATLPMGDFALVLGLEVHLR